MDTPASSTAAQSERSSSATPILQPQPLPERSDWPWLTTNMQRAESILAPRLRKPAQFLLLRAGLLLLSLGVGFTMVRVLGDHLVKSLRDGS